MTDERHPIEARRARRRGQSLIEFAVVASLLLFLVCGVIDFGRMILQRQSLAWISREAANLSARGTALPDAVRAVLVSARRLDLQRNGAVVLTKVSRDTFGVATITDRATAGAYTLRSRIGDAIGVRATLPVRGQQLVPNDGTAYVAELSVRFTPITPIGRLLHQVLPTELSDVAYF